MIAAERQEAREREATIAVAGVTFVADPEGVLYWPEHRLLAVADLHLEKGSSYAARGMLLPPYDTAATLLRLAHLIGFYAPRYVLAIGDSFHDGEGPSRLSRENRDNLRGLQRGCEWIWLTGNHDPKPAPEVGGRFRHKLAVGGLTFQHEPTGVLGEITGHLHPMGRVCHYGRTVSRRCFAANHDHLVMPAFGAYTGGLNVRDCAFYDVFRTLDFTAHLLGDNRLYSFAAERCLPD